MDKNVSTDPRSIRARRALHEALKQLLKAKPFSKITVTDITREAGLSRHTFYNHYETRDDLLNNLVDKVLDQFFSMVEEMKIVNIAKEEDQRIGEKFFQIWQDNAEVFKLLRTVDIDKLLIDRLEKQFAKYLFEYIDGKIVNVNPNLANYLTSHNAYAFVGILRQWLKDDMRHSPQVMGNFLNHFASHEKNMEAIKKFNNLIQ